MLDARGLKKTFFAGTPDARLALDDASLNLPQGAFCVVIGSNGAGKSTFLNAIAGKIALDEGTICVGGNDVTASPVHRRARFIARVFQDPMIGTAPGMSVEENLLLAELRPQTRRLAFGLTVARRERYRGLLAILGLGLEDRLGTRVDLLSGGQRQALSLIMAVSAAPSLLLLDEHTAALDPRTAAIVMEATVKAVAEFNLTTLMVTHNMHHAIEFGDRLVMMEAGRIKLEIGGTEKQGLSVEDLVQRFKLADDKILLAG